MKEYLKKKILSLKFFYFFTLAVLFVLFLLLSYFNVRVKEDLAKTDIYLSPLSFLPADYPSLQNKNAPEISAQGVVILDRDSNVILYSKNPDVNFLPASTTKIMTAITALDYFRMGDTLSVKREGIEGSVIGLKTGEALSFEDLMYAMLLPSANDATVVIAQNYPGGEVEFVKRMNEKARAMNLKNTFFNDVSGLSDQSFISPRDLATLAKIAMDDEEFAKIVGTKEKEIKTLAGRKIKIKNLNILLESSDVVGVKTGFTEAAGEVLVTSKKIGDRNHNLIVVVMQSENRFNDTERLFRFLDSSVTFSSTRPQ